MAFLSATFTMPSYSSSGLSTEQDWCDALLTNLKDAFIAANDAWEQIGTIETIGTNTNTGYGTRTIQLHSTASGKYVRIWSFANYTRVQFVENPTSSGNYNALNLYLGNILRYSGSYACFGNSYNTELFFAVSDNNIDADFGLDLGLSCPAFGLTNYYIETYYAVSLSDPKNSPTFKLGADFIVITDGNMFSVLRKVPSYDTWHGCFYAPDMIVPANGDDTNTEGVVTTIDINRTIYFGSNSAYDAENYLKILYNDANGNHDFGGWGLGIYNSKGILCMSESSSKLLCAPLEVHLYPTTYAGSTMSGIVSGVGTKGWVNTDYLRSCSITQLTSDFIGHTFADGRWVCPNEGVLICWDSSNSNPFEAAT